jgi:quinoprotein glucose dehydrogenase
VNEALNKFPDDPALAKLRADVLRGGLLLSLEPSQVDKIRAEVAKKGNPQRGKELYLNTKLLACATCHRMEGVGGSVGPDLSRLWDTMTVEKILESIVDPSKEIKEGFQTYRVTTLDSKVYVGLKVKDDAKEVVIRDPNGRDIRVAKDDVEALGPSKLSLMPDNVVSQISYEQFIDLLAFLKSRSAQESLRGQVVDAGIAGPFPVDVTSVKSETISDDKWKLLTAEPNGKLDLKTAFGTMNTQAVYVRAYVFAPKKQKATVAIDSENPWRAWVNGSTADPTASFEVDLKEGWNVVLVKVANGGKPPALGVRVTGDGLRTAPKPDPLPASSTGGP